MNKIFRLMNAGLILAVAIALGAIAGVAQDTCIATEVEAAQDKFDVEYKKGLKDRAGRREAIRLGKEFIEKYGASCDIAKVRVDWLKVNIPVKEQELIKALADDAENILITRFNESLKMKNWDEAYASGKEIMAKHADKYRPVEIVLGTIGGEEAFKGNFKYSDDAIRFAKQSIADLETGKAFLLGKDTVYGLSLLKPGTPRKPKYTAEDFLYNFAFDTKEEAIGWLNLYVGYITQVAQKNKIAALPYLYKSTLGNTGSSKQPTAYGLIGYYYVEQGDKLVDEIKALEAAQDPKDTEEVAKQKVDAIKGKVAISNGTNQRAIDAFARAYNLSTDIKYKADIKKALDFSYNRRFGKMDGIDAWIATVVKQPFENPSNPVTPVSDPEPVTTTSSTTTTPPATNGKPVTTAPATKPATTPATKPATTPATKPVATKPSASIKKPVKKRGAK